MLRIRAVGTLLAVVLTVVAVPASVQTCGNQAYASHVPCCKYCVRGKACGNTCIARWKTCWVGHGYACDAWSSEQRLVFLSTRAAVAQ